MPIGLVLDEQLMHATPSIALIVQPLDQPPIMLGFSLVGGPRLTLALGPDVAMQRKMFAPRGERDCCVIALIIGERAPHGKAARIVYLLLSERTIERGHDVMALGELRPAGDLFEHVSAAIVPFEQATAARLRPLLILPSKGILAKQFASHHRGR